MVENSASVLRDIISFLIAHASFIAYLSMPFIFLTYGSHVEASGNSHDIFFTGGGRFWERTAASNTGVVVLVTALAGIALAATVFYTARGNLKSPWSNRKTVNPLSPEQWRSFFTPEGKLEDGGIKFLKKVRSAGVDPTIRAEVWPFLLGVFNLNSSSEEREVIRNQKRKEYGKLRKRCLKLLNCNEELSGLKNREDSSSRLRDEMNHKEDDEEGEEINSPNTETAVSARTSLEEGISFLEDPGSANSSCMNTPTFQTDTPTFQSDSSDSDSSKEAETTDTFPLTQNTEDTDDEPPSVKGNKIEDFSTWQRIIRLDAIRANGDWISYSPTKIEISLEKANHLAKEVGLKDYDHLEPCRIFHAARLVAILEAYAIFDPEIGYCQGMSDLLSPMIAVILNDHEAFWCFVGFMKKARHNFRLDEVGIRRQLNIVSRIIRFKDSHLYRHLEMLQAGDCFFVYRMVVVLFRRELTFEQTLCLWEVMWADQAAIRSGIGKTAWSRIRLRAPPTDDLLLYAIAASVLQRRKKIIQKYSGMDEILRECNSMAGQLDVWKLLDDAHDLVMNLHNKIETPL
ncbi:rab GTPase-activating protein 22-like [Impatiens glandulifera]|uniref:rab GTPase-activating protein 22-like n=1 Tax=Impatiens glandulifera TaxID=253017 RepID=UPI001FB05745|nr:rab GTPase-activating protein 22-like [Impatiens glandulifera]